MAFHLLAVSFLIYFERWTRHTFYSIQLCFRQSFVTNSLTVNRYFFHFIFSLLSTSRCCFLTSSHFFPQVLPCPLFFLVSWLYYIYFLYGGCFNFVFCPLPCLFPLDFFAFSLTCWTLHKNQIEPWLLICIKNTVIRNWWEALHE